MALIKIRDPFPIVDYKFLKFELNSRERKRSLGVDFMVATSSAKPKVKICHQSQAFPYKMISIHWAWLLGPSQRSLVSSSAYYNRQLDEDEQLQLPSSGQTRTLCVYNDPYARFITESGLSDRTGACRRAFVINPTMNWYCSWTGPQKSARRPLSLKTYLVVDGLRPMPPQPVYDVRQQDRITAADLVQYHIDGDERPGTIVTSTIRRYYRHLANKHRRKMKIRKL